MNEQARQNQEKGHYLHRTVFLIDRLANQTLRAEVGITLPQFLFLLSLDGTANLPLTQQSIANHLGIDKAAVSRHVDRLLRKKWIVRTAASSRREQAIRLSDEGLETLRHAQGIMQRTMTPHYQKAGPDLVTQLQAMCESLEQVLNK